MSDDILNDRLPNIKLSYGNLLHKKVKTDFYQLVPRGLKCLLWYTYWKKDNVCYILYLNNDVDSIKNVEKTFAFYNNNICYGKGTILSGYIFKHNKINIFSAIDIHFYKGIDLYHEKNSKKLEILNNMLSKDIKQTIYSTNQILVAYPVTCKSYNDALQMAKTSAYSIYSIALFNNNDTTQKGYYKYSPKKQLEAVFIVKPQSSYDMYDLYTDINSKPHCIASITDYKTSVMMNNLFRNIKENKNLDFLEESDDEEEFENINEDKYVNLEKSEVMTCVYITRFNKWKPILVCDKTTPLTSKKEIIMMENQYSNNKINSNINKRNYKQLT